MARDLDALIAEQIFGWKMTNVGPDYDGKNECQILTEHGEIPQGFELPPKGLIHRGYMCPCYSSDWNAAIRLARRVGLKQQGWPTSPEELAQTSYKYWRASPSPLPTGEKND